MESSDSKPKQKMTESERTELARKLDEDLDRFIEDLAAKKKSEPKKPFDFDEWCRDLDQHPAFMKELKPNEQGEYSEAVQALQALKYDDADTEEERFENAEHHKNEGNKHFKFKKYRWATDCYTSGIKCMCSDRALNSVLFANRAAAQKRLLNLRSALRDCVFARRFNPLNTKAIIRGAECLLELGYGQQCLDWIDSSICQFDKCLDESGDDKDSGIENRKALVGRLEELKDAATRCKMVEEKNARMDKLAVAKDNAAKQKLLKAFVERHLQFRPRITLDDPSLFEWSQIEVRLPQLKEHQSVRVDDDGVLHWPLLIQYPEFGQVDFLTDCCENSTLTEVLASIFGHPAEWDVNCSICKDNVRYFVSLDVDDDEVLEIDSDETLREIFSSKDVVVRQGLPVVQVYTKKRASEGFSTTGVKRYKVL